MNKKECCICAQLAGEQKRDLLSQLNKDSKYTRRVALESRLSAVIPSLGPLVDGHSLICPKKHRISLAEMSPEELGDLVAVSEHLERVLRKCFGMPVHRFEHGNAKNLSRVVCSVEHAHLHLLPAEVNLVDVLINEHGFQEIAEGVSSLPQIAGEEEYIFYSSPSGDSFIRTLEVEKIPSQFFRRLFAASLGNRENWNWRDEPMPHRANSLFEKLRDHHLVG